MEVALDNPVWSSLTGVHAYLATIHGHAARYPAQIAPFVAVESRDAAAVADLRAIVEPGETVLLVGPAPPFDSDWRASTAQPIAQMVCTEPPARSRGPAIVPLTQAQRAAMLDLTARVYPHYFRERTPELGRYFGISDGATLAAMAGERMRFRGHRELSAICTDPRYLGRGYAAHLVATLTRDVLALGESPFLHVSHENERAVALYARLGYRFRADMPLLSATRLC